MVIQNHYLTDRRIGNMCCINGESTYEKYNADLESVTPIAGSLSSKYINRVGRNGFMTLYQDIEPGGLKLVFYVGGMTRDDCEINCSRLIAACKDCVITIEDESFEYVAILAKQDVERFPIDYWNIVTLEFVALKRLPVVEFKERVTLLDNNPSPHSFGQWYIPSDKNRKNMGTIPSGIEITVRIYDYDESLNDNGVELLFTNEIDSFYGTPPDGTTMIKMKKGNVVTLDGIGGRVQTYGTKDINVQMFNFPKILPNESFDIYVKTKKMVDLEVTQKFYPVFLN